MMGEIGGRIAENWQPFLSILIAWVLPFIVVFGAIWLGYYLKSSKDSLKGKPAIIQKEMREDTTFSQIHDLEMGKHITKIVELLNIFKKQLLTEVSKKSKVLSLQVSIEKQREFPQVWEHCPSINKAGLNLRLSRILYEAKLKSNSVVDEDNSYIKERMKALSEAIDSCLSDSEYLEHSCSKCIGKRKQLSTINVASNDTLVQNNEGSQSLGDGIQSIVTDKAKLNARLRHDIGILIIEGKEVLMGFKSVRTFGDVPPIDEFQHWRGEVTKTLQNSKLVDYYPLWFSDVGIEIKDSLLKDFIEACEAGLERLEEILKALRE